jgi:hypothetical protein
MPRKCGVIKVLRKFRTIRHSLALLLTGLLCMPMAWAQGSIDEQPNAFAMTGDLLVARPIGLGLTVIGGAAFILSLPFTALAGSVGESAEALVLGPAETTFMRCLGCIQPGYSGKDRERYHNAKDDDQN